ncbi:MAG TPA: peptidase C14 [Planctomycetes bacterium]|nr:peptidase C14 [Planctomycetota bacterium]
MRKLAVCIGINDYPGTDSDLAGCVNDAKDWEAVLAARGFQVGTLMDRRAKKKEISAAIARLLAEAASGDLVVVQYSGHGSFIPDEDGDEADGVDEVLCPWDIDKGNLLSDDELDALFERRAAGVRVVMIADSCHSGTVSRLGPERPPVPGGARAPKARFMPPVAFMTAFAPLRPRAARRRPAGPNALLLAGCQDGEFSYDAWFGNRANGAFTRAALDTLAALPESGTYRDWYKAIRTRLPSREHPQTPNLLGTAAQKAWRVLG